jgi:hypothetical protein
MDLATSPSDQHCALARSLVSHFVNTPLAIVVAAVDHLEGTLVPTASPRPHSDGAFDALSDARVGLERLRVAASVLLTGIPSGEPKSALLAGGRVLVVTSDTSASAAICAALHGDSVTVCETVSQALRLIERSEPFEVIFCDAVLAVAWLLVRVAWQEPAPRVAFMATKSSDRMVAEFLERHALYVDARLAFGRIRELAEGK